MVGGAAVRFLRRRLRNTATAPTITTDRLELAPYQQPVELLTLTLDHGVRRWMLWPARTRKQALRHARARAKRDRLERVGDFMALSVHNRHTGAYVGDASATVRVGISGQVTIELGWVVTPPRQGEGYATEMTLGLIEHLNETVRPVRYYARMDARNGASQHLALRLGFTYVCSAPYQLKGEPSIERIFVRNP
jgi:RimJ/RimL family protein N-acetyltransferase